ncbi:hypothetical protein A3D77_06720 [Candidatus Gottesmanbacteria bacterium RIFCSPHIGHO2_02_FULL_39_11]|uniref:Uncharacterized protein n=1 Tax=Candidatus Gottesmanbacteria bacterium RIFCSPHIGHO2_02_FULL_39_11 TaxID=1798382 RepID=A0A1F5ZSX2_9BACT|nr:MAG: hypothetical protein A3D77_06720 [Candidatus Gottesmanbacteria bacterium RIFCSPHIGHO2_02_FULL_39_11]
MIVGTILIAAFIIGVWKIAASWIIKTAPTSKQISPPAPSQASPIADNPDIYRCQTEINGNQSTPELISCARLTGKITEEERILYLTYAVGDIEKLPSEYKSNAPWEGTSILIELNDIVSSDKPFCDFTQNTQNELRKRFPNAVKCS